MSSDNGDIRKAKKGDIWIAKKFNKTSAKGEDLYNEVEYVIFEVTDGNVFFDQKGIFYGRTKQSIGTIWQSKEETNGRYSYDISKAKKNEIWTAIVFNGRDDKENIDLYASTDYEIHHIEEGKVYYEDNDGNIEYKDMGTFWIKKEEQKDAKGGGKIRKTKSKSKSKTIKRKPSSRKPRKNRTKSKHLRS